MSESIKVHKIAGGEIALWLDPAGAICLKIVAEGDDPVEMSEDEALACAELLTRLVRESRG